MPANSTDSSKAKAAFGFNAKSLKAKAWAKKFAGERLRKVDDETKLAVRKIVVDSIHQGIPPRDAAKQIRSVVGMNRPQAKSWQKYYQGLSPNLSSKAKDKAGDRLRKKYIRRRAITIARTEVIDSLAAGTEQAWTQAQQKNLLGKNAKKKWLATGFGACAICRKLAMEEAVPLNENFKATFAPPSLKPISRPTAHPNCRCALIPVPGTGGSMFPGGAGVVSAVGEAAWMDSLLSKKVGGQKGSNMGGLYEDAAGKKYYVKEYKNPQQAMTEAAANSVYKELGLEVPESFVRVGSDGKTYFVSKWIDDMDGTLGKLGMTAKDAEQILDGFVADVFTANWDAVGTGLDNVVRLANGKIIRIDQGGAFLFRAQGALKPSSVLNKITEWENFVKKNPYYKQVFQKAGLKNADELAERAIKQIDELQKVRVKYGSWDNFLKKTNPNLDSTTRKQIAEMMEERYSKLWNKRASLETQKIDTISPQFTKAAAKKTDDLGKKPVIFDEDWDPAYHVAMDDAGIPKVNSVAQAQKFAGYLEKQIEQYAALGMSVDDDIYAVIEINYKFLKKLDLKGDLKKLVAEFDDVPLPAPVPAPKNIYKKNLTVKQLATAKRNDEIWARTLAGEKPKDIAAALDLNVNNVRRILRDLKKSSDLPSRPSVVEAFKARFKFWTDKEIRKGSQKLQKELVAKYKGYLQKVKDSKSTTTGLYRAVRSYTGGGYGRMNTALREMTRGIHTPKWSSSSKALQKFLIDAPPPPDNLVVWRGTDIVGRVVDRKGAKALQTRALDAKEIRDGDIVQLDGFQSTAIKPEKAWAHGNKTMLEIHPSCGAYVDIISSNSGEKEFIIPHGMKFRVAGVKELRVNRPPRGIRKMKVLQLEAIGGCPKLP